MKFSSFVLEPEEVGGYSGHANKCVMKRAQKQAMFSWP